MPLELKTSKAEIDAYLTKRVERMTQALIFNLKVIGEKVVNRGRITAEKGRDFTDQTGNLRSSIGYVISMDGQIVTESSFEVVKNGAEGAEQGRKFAYSIANQCPSGICLVVVAGKSYAKYVAARGYDVLDSSELLARQLIPQMLKELGM